MLVSDIPALRRHWHPVGPQSMVAAAPVGTRVLGADVVLWRSEEGLRAAVDRCPHRFARLSLGQLDAGVLVCPYHAWSYGPDGAAVHLPQLDPGLPIPPTARLQMVHVRERYGLLWVALDEPLGDVPALREGDSAGYRLIFSFDQLWESAAPWITDNAIDIAHVNVVHAATIGNAQARYLDPYEVETSDEGFRAHLSLSVSGVQTQGAGVDGVAERAMDVELVGPFTSRIAIRYPTGVEHVLFIMACPVDDHRSRYIQLLARNDTEADVPAAQLLDLDRQVVAEDRAICESLPADFSLDPRSMVSLRADRITLHYRRYLSRLMACADAPA